MYDRNEAMRAEQDLAKPYPTEAQILQGLEDGMISLEKAQMAFAWLERREKQKEVLERYGEEPEMTEAGVNKFLDFIQADRVAYWQTQRVFHLPENVVPMRRPYGAGRKLKHKGPIARMWIRRTVDFARRKGFWSADAVLEFAEQAEVPAGIRRWLSAGFDNDRFHSTATSFVSRIFFEYDVRRLPVHKARAGSVDEALEPYQDEIAERCVEGLMEFADRHQMTSVRELFHSLYLPRMSCGRWLVENCSAVRTNMLLDALYERRGRMVRAGFDPLRPDGKPLDPHAISFSGGKLPEEGFINDDLNLALWIIHRGFHAEGPTPEESSGSALLPFVPVTEDEIRFQDERIRKKCIELLSFKEKIKFLWSLPWRMRKWFRKGHIITQDEYRAIVKHLKKRGKEI